MLVTKQQAADLLDVPLRWLDGMIELGQVPVTLDESGREMIDTEELRARKLIPPKEQPVPGLEHVRAMLRKVTGQSAES